MIACARGCTIRGQHRTDCTDEACTGCLARPAATGYAVCTQDVDRALEALHTLPGLWVDVEAAGVLRAPQKGVQGSGRPIPLDADGAEWRTRLRACLVGWCLVLEEDFSASLSGAQDTVAWMIDRVGVYAGRILASEHADQLVADLCGWVEEDGTRHEGLAAEGIRLSFRSRSLRGVRVQCPACPERVRLDPAKDVIECRCGQWGTQLWWRDHIAPSVDGPVPMGELLAWLLLNHRAVVEKATVRQWAHRGAITTTRDDETGATLYDPIEVAAQVQAKGARRSRAECACGHSRLKHDMACIHWSKEQQDDGTWLVIHCSCTQYESTEVGVMSA